LIVQVPLSPIDPALLLPKCAVTTISYPTGFFCTKMSPLIFSSPIVYFFFVIGLSPFLFPLLRANTVAGGFPVFLFRSLFPHPFVAT